MPYFGLPYGTTGSVAISNIANTKGVSKVALDFDGALSSISVGWNTGAANTASRAVIYDSTGSGGLPGNLLGVSQEVTPNVTTNFAVYPFATPISLTAAGGPYWLGLWFSSATGTTYGFTLTNGLAYNTNTYSSTGNPSNPFGASPTQTGNRYVVYGTYDIAESDSWRGFPSGLGGAVSGSLAGGAAFVNANQMYVVPVLVTGATINNIYVQLSQTYASANIRGVIYNDNNGVPGTLLGSTNALAGPTGGNVNTLSFASAVSVSPHSRIWIGIQTDTTLQTYLNLINGSGYTVAATYSSGAPSSFGSGSVSNNLINLWLGGTFSTNAVQLGASAREALITNPTISANLAGVAREALLTNPTTSAYLAGLAREALISGVGAMGTAKAISEARSGPLTLVTTGPPPLFGKASSMSFAGAAPAVTLPLAAKAKATSAARSPSGLIAYLAGKIGTESSAVLDVPGRFKVRTRVSAESSARTGLAMSAALHGRIEATSSAGVQQLPFRVNMNLRTSAQSHGSIFIPQPLALPGGRITSRSRGVLYFAPRPPSALSEAVSLNMG